MSKAASLFLISIFALQSACSTKKTSHARPQAKVSTTENVESTENFPDAEPTREPIDIASLTETELEALFTKILNGEQYLNQNEVDALNELSLDALTDLTTKSVIAEDFKSEISRLANADAETELARVAAYSFLLLAGTGYAINALDAADADTLKHIAQIQANVEERATKSAASLISDAQIRAKRSKLEANMDRPLNGREVNKLRVQRINSYKRNLKRAKNAVERNFALQKLGTEFPRGGRPVTKALSAHEKKLTEETRKTLDAELKAETNKYRSQRRWAQFKNGRHVMSFIPLAAITASILAFQKANRADDNAERLQDLKLKLADVQKEFKAAVSRWSTIALVVAESEAHLMGADSIEAELEIIEEESLSQEHGLITQDDLQLGEIY